MTSLIEQAAQRLEQLRQAGVVLPGDEQAAPAAVPQQPVATGPAPAAAPAAPESPRTVGISVVDDGPHPSSKRVELDVVALAAQGFLMPHTPRSQTGDQYRVIKRPLIKNAMGKGAATINHANLLMVTSALAGEGKSFTSINLALSIAAELDNTVMLVDADVARPSVLRMLGLPQGPGLLDVLEERVDMSEVLLRTNVEKLTILPSGTPHPRATELLASDAMSHLLDDMAKRYPDRIIIFDSPPLLLTTESRVLASHMGQIIVVVHAEKSGQDDAAQPGQPECRRRLWLWIRLRVWLRLRLWIQQQ
jgi:exopolysaccharide/PEP-CTERM locus tyrosine autokinase